jgi:hypothetical protein
VDGIIKNMDRKGFPDEAINWGDLRCVEARQYVGTDPAWHVIIEEAAPDSSMFRREIESHLLQTHGIRAEVSTEWQQRDSCRPKQGGES